MFLEQIADTDDVFAVVFRAQLRLHVIHPRLQLIRLTVERQRLHRRHTNGNCKLSQTFSNNTTLDPQSLLTCQFLSAVLQRRKSCRNIAIFTKF